MDGFKVSYRKAKTSDTVESALIPVEDSGKHSHILSSLEQLKRYWIRVGAVSGSTVLWSEPKGLYALPPEPMRVWFIEDTPTSNWNSERLFMSVNTNREDDDGDNTTGASAYCHVNGGGINCPPETLVSLEIYEGGIYNVKASSNFNADGRNENARTDGAIEITDAGYVPYAEVSAKREELEVRWPTKKDGSAKPTVTKNGVDHYRELTSYVIEYITPTGTIWVEKDKTDNVDRLTGLPNGEYLVKVHTCLTETTTEPTDANPIEPKKCNVVIKQVEDDSDPPKLVNVIETSEGTVLGGNNAPVKITLTSLDVVGPGVPREASVRFEPDTNGKFVEFYRPIKDGGARIHGYKVRYTDQDGGSDETVMVPFMPHDVFSVKHSFPVRGLESGTYSVSVKALNINGESDWVDVGSVTLN